MRCAASCLAVGSVILGWLALAAAAVPARAKADATDAPAKTDAADAPAKTDAADAPAKTGAADAPAKAASPAAKVDQAPADADVAKPAPVRKRPLSPASIALRDRVRQTLDHYFHQQVNTGENTPAEILAFCLAFG
jgi:hypothetical protein